MEKFDKQINVPESQCKHHWMIDSPSGPVSKGVCRFCNEEREFKNYTEFDRGYDNRSTLEQLIPQRKAGGFSDQVFQDVEDEVA